MLNECPDIDHFPERMRPKRGEGRKKAPPERMGLIEET